MKSLYVCSFIIFQPEESQRTNTKGDGKHYLNASFVRIMKAENGFWAAEGCGGPGDEEPFRAVGRCNQEELRVDSLWENSDLCQENKNQFLYFA